jgi:uncharacterized membrane protein
MDPSHDELEVLRAQVAALTTRVHRLEEKAGLQGSTPSAVGTPQQSVVPPPVAPVRPVLTTPPPTPPIAPTFQRPAAKRRESEDLEGTIGKLWLNRIGILAILIGVSYFIKYAFDNGWIGPAGRIAVGLIAGIALVIWSEAFRKKGYLAFSWSLKAVGIGTLYLSLWGAFQIYHLIPAEAAFVAMIAVTGSTIALALSQDAEILAAFALAGGFTTPVLLSTGQNHEVALFAYVLLLDIAVLAMVAIKPWHKLIVGSFIGTAILYVGWFSEYYTKPQRDLTLLFTILFAGCFAACPLIIPLTKSRWQSGFAATLMLLPLVNAAAFFLSIYVMYENEYDTLTWFALGSGAAYLALSSRFTRRPGSEPKVVQTINLLHVAIAIAFITIAVPLKLNGHWITLGWLVESAVLLFVAVRAESGFLRYFAATTLTLGIIRLLVIDNFQVQTLVFNSRFATYLVALAILGGIIVYGHRFSANEDAPFIKIAGIAFNILALVALTLEASDYFGRQVTEWYGRHQAIEYRALQQIEFSRNFSYSAIWLIYGAALMAVGFWRRSAFVRWQALILIAFTIGKVFLYDVSNLQQGYRILSFIALGAVLMGISFVYHRGWLQLSDQQGNSTSRTTA